MGKKALKIAICGYYGQGNFGDEAILRVILSKLKRQNTNSKIYILKNKNPISAIRGMAGADVFIFGGGSILQNVTSNASLLYYLAIIGLSSLVCKRKIMLANGIGPIVEHKIPLKILISATARAINSFDYISVRDTDSQKLLQNIVPNRKIHIIPDPALISFKKINQRLTKPQKNLHEDCFFIYIPHSRSVAKHRITAQELSNSLSIVSATYGARLKIVVLNEKEDLYLAREIATRVEKTEIVIIRNEYEAARDFRGANFTISSRYHGTLLTTVLGIPTLSVSTDPKICALCKDFSLCPAELPEVLKSSAKLSEKVEEILNYSTQNSFKIYNSIQKSVACAEKSLNRVLKF